MASFTAPAGGLTLTRAVEKPPDFPSDVIAGEQPAQVMNLSLASTIIDELVDVLVKGESATLQLGKRPAIKFGSKTHTFPCRADRTRCDLFAMHPDTSETSAYHLGMLSHQLGVRKVPIEQNNDDLDAATAALRQRMETMDRAKEHRKTHLIHSLSEIQALGAGDKRSATGRQAASFAQNPTSRCDVEKERFFAKSIEHRSNLKSTAGKLTPLPPPPVTTASVSLLTPAQKREQRRINALRVPFIHLLAMRPLSVKFIAKTTRASPEDIRRLVDKYAQENKLDKDKVQLRDRSYKELDPWSFPYPSDEDRQEAINNAISAFDRMRVGKTESIWQILLPKEERGKGKVLSKLNLTAAGKRSLPVPAQRAGSEALSATGNESENTIGGATPHSTTGRASTTLSNNKASEPAKVKTTKPETKPKKEKPDSTTMAKATTTNATATKTKTTTKIKAERGTKKSTASSRIKSEELMPDSDDDEEFLEISSSAKRKPTSEKPDVKGAQEISVVPTHPSDQEAKLARDREREIQRRMATEQPKKSQKSMPSAKTSAQPASLNGVSSRKNADRALIPPVKVSASRDIKTIPIKKGTRVSSPLVSPPVNASDVECFRPERTTSLTPSASSTSPRKNAHAARATGMTTPVSTEASHTSLTASHTKKRKAEDDQERSQQARKKPMSSSSGLTTATISGAKSSAKSEALAPSKLGKKRPPDASPLPHPREIKRPRQLSTSSLDVPLSATTVSRKTTMSNGDKFDLHSSAFKLLEKHAHAWLDAWRKYRILHAECEDKKKRTKEKVEKLMQQTNRLSKEKTEIITRYKKLLKTAKERDGKV
ncbi:hypothetical protein KEM54_002025, partial [Ascosphaera aggregata]